MKKKPQAQKPVGAVGEVGPFFRGFLQIVARGTTPLQYSSIVEQAEALMADLQQGRQSPLLKSA